MDQLGTAAHTDPASEDSFRRPFTPMFSLASPLSHSLLPTSPPITHPFIEEGEEIPSRRGVLLRQNRRDAEQKGKKRYPLQHIKWVNLVVNENLALNLLAIGKNSWYSLRYRCGGLHAQ